MNLHNVMDAAAKKPAAKETFEGWNVENGKLQAPKGWFTEQAIIGTWTKSSLAAAQKRYDAAHTPKVVEEGYSWYNPIGWVVAAFSALTNLISNIFTCFGLCGEEVEAPKEPTKK